MAWIELHQTLPRHPKLIRLANRLRVPRAQAAGHLTFLWLWTLDYAPTGDLSAFGPAEISAAADFGGDAELFAKALVETGWLDKGMKVHAWADYGGKSIRERDQSRARMRVLRERQSALRERSPNNTVTCANGDEHRSVTPPSPSPPSSSPLPPTPPLTPPSPSPSPCPQALSKARAHEGQWPTLQEVLGIAELRGITKECAEKWWLEHDARGGLDRTGQPLGRWESSLLAYSTAWRGNAEKERQRNGSQNSSRSGQQRPDRNAGTANEGRQGQYAHHPNVKRV